MHKAQLAPAHMGQVQLRGSKRTSPHTHTHGDSHTHTHKEIETNAWHNLSNRIIKQSMSALALL